MSSELFYLLLFGLPLAAFLYASVGHGGASTYITLMTIAGLASTEIKPSALILNIIISGIAFLAYRKSVEFPWKLFSSLVIFSIPAAYIGAKIELDEEVYKKVIGIILFFPIARFLNIFPAIGNSCLVKNTYQTTDNSLVKNNTHKNWISALLGLSIGFISGLIGIGGGIILSPLLLLLGWTNMKETAAISALFIFVNSIAGIISYEWPLHLSKELWTFMPLTIISGSLGAYLGARKFENKTLKILLTIILIMASIKLIFF